MTKGRITFYRPDRRTILKEELPFENYNAALRYAQAMRRVHGWDIKDIRMLEEAGVKVHKYNREY
ncbi:hypothetical protein LCGC14_1956590 [marine sediment metagenome]|uniref:Uncharacterized protein n=1 Tax=marine sediment metagenome TaxID=412755 RepID=A0A0F9FG60_9ZZZZ